MVRSLLAALWLPLSFAATEAEAVWSTDRDWDVDDPRPRVLLVHGFASSADAMRSMADALRTRGAVTARFGYDADVSIADAARSLAAAINDNVARTQRPVTVVTHSMGALVARWMLEVDAAGGDRVGALVMVAPPNDPSSLASLSVGDVARRFAPRGRLADPDRRALDAVDRMLARRLGPVAGELREGSKVYRELAATRRADGVRYAIFAGDAGPIDPSIMTAAKMLSRFDNPGRREHDPGGALIELADREEWIRGRGDGVVSVRSTRLPDVDDHVVLPIDHAAATTAGPMMDTLVEAVMTRLAVEQD